MPVALLTRRAAVRGTLVTAVGAAAGYLAARTRAAARGRPGTTAANAYGRPAGSPGRLLLPLSQLPSGGGVVLADDGVVLTRTPAGDVHAFSPVCTHQGCTVDKVSNGTIRCPCHGSTFDASTGAVTGGPAPSPLPTIAVAVRDAAVYRA